MLKLAEGIYMGTATPASGGGGSAVIEELNVTPITSAQVITAPSGTDGYNPVNVSAVTSSIDANITAANIVDGITILGVTGSATELNGTILNVTPTTAAQTITPTIPNNGFTEVYVDAVTSSIDANIQAENIKSGVSILEVTGNVNALVGQTKSVSQNGVVTPDTGYNGLTSVTVNVPSKLIKSNYWIDTSGIVHNFQDINGTTISANTTTLTNPVDYYGGDSNMQKIDFSAITDANDFTDRFSNCTNLTEVDFSGITLISGINAFYGAFSNGPLITKINFSGLITVSGQRSLFQFARGCTNLTNIDFSSLTTVSGNYAFGNALYGCTSLTNASFPSLTEVSGDNAFDSAFYGCTDLISANFSSLTTISGVSGFGSCLSGCTNLTNIDFSSLTNVGESAMGSCCSDGSSIINASFPKLSMIGKFGLRSLFARCTSLTDVYFNSLTTTSFGSNSNQFYNMLSSTGTNVTHTLHFPSNLSSTISGLSGYPLFGGTSGYVTLAFDLPATS